MKKFFDDSNKIIDETKFIEIIKNKKIYIYGTNVEAIGFLRRFSKLGIKTHGLIDSRNFEKKTRQNVPIIHPSKLINDGIEIFILVAARDEIYREKAINFCKQLGLEYKISWMVTEDLCRYTPLVDVVGPCNLRCISCPKGIPGANNHQGMMSVDIFRRVIDKMTREMPFLNSVHLYNYGEPLLHPNLAEIINIASHEFGISTAISTNLNNGRNLEKVVQANPDVMYISCSGIGKNYEITHTEGKWDIFLNNLNNLNKLIKKYKPETNFQIRYHIYGHNLQEDYEKAKKLFEDMGFLFSPTIAHVYPEKILQNLAYGFPIPETVKKAGELTLYNIEEQIEAARKEKDAPCSIIDMFPSIRWDCSIIHCCSFSNPIIHKNYLDLDLKNIEEIRKNNGFCNLCTSYGMHRMSKTKFDIIDKKGKLEVKLLD